MENYSVGEISSWGWRYIKSIVTESFEQLIATFRYIFNNPVKAGMVENPEEYIHGSLWFIRHKYFNLVEPPQQYLFRFKCCSISLISGS